MAIDTNKLVINELNDQITMLQQRCVALSVELQKARITADDAERARIVAEAVKIGPGPTIEPNGI